MRSLRCSAFLFGDTQPHRLDQDAVHDALLRTGRLAELLPEVAEIDLSPVIAGPRGCLIVDARILLRPAEWQDPVAAEPRVTHLKYHGVCLTELIISYHFS
jgi:ATP-grasp domain